MQSIRESYCRGIDVSHWQGEINWKLVKNDGVFFAFIKATEGVDYQDPRFSVNFREAKKAGIYTGAYHFCTPSDTEDAVHEAEFFISIVKKTGGFDIFNLPPVIDIEQNRGLDKKQVSTIIQTWIETVREQARVDPIIYSYSYFIRDYIDSSLCDASLWLAHYDLKQLPDIPGWKSWLFFQYTDKGRVNGIEGNVDLNVFAGDIKTLEKYCIKKK